MTISTRQLGLAALLAGLMATMAGRAEAELIRTFDLTYSGVDFGNLAVATGTITLDLDLVNNPGDTQTGLTHFVKAFSITVSGASSGNGTFGLDDYSTDATLSGSIFLNTNGRRLDFGRELIGQPTEGDPFGTVPSFGDAGDFNFFSNRTDPAAPSATFYFQITTAGGFGDSLYLTSFRPVPEPSSLALCAMAALCGLGYARSNRQAASESLARS